MPIQSSDDQQQIALSDQILNKQRSIIRKQQMQIQKLETELNQIHSARYWKVVQAYMRLKARIIIQPRAKLQMLVWKCRHEGIWRTLRAVIRKLRGSGNAVFGPAVQQLPSAAVYGAWFHENRVELTTLFQQRDHCRAWKDRPLITLIIPVYNSRAPWLNNLLETVLAQTYDHWETLLIDDHSTDPDTLAALKNWIGKDKRFKLIQRRANGGVAQACQDGLENAHGEFATVVDHDDLLEPNALYEIASCMADHPDADVIYSDEILIDASGNLINAAFRPDFSYNRLLSHPYIVHLTAFRRQLALKVGGFDTTLKVSQDYDLLLRLAGASRHFIHIPKVLYRWRTYPSSTGHKYIETVVNNSVMVLTRHLQRAGMKDAYAEAGLSFNFFKITYPIQPAKISIIIPTKDRLDLLLRCIESIENLTQLPSQVSYEIVIADNNSEKPETREYFDTLRQNGHQIVSCPGAFNFSRINNQAASHCRGKILLFLNNDIEVIDEYWLAAMLQHAQRPEIGAVGAKLIYPDLRIQHAGVIVGIHQFAGHSHQFFAEYDGSHFCPGHLGELFCVRECTAVTAACMMVRRDVFDQVGGFDENLAVGCNDTDLCLRIRQAGYLNLWTPFARLIHYESASRGKEKNDIHLHPKDVELFKKRWKKWLKDGDPYYNPNLSRQSSCFEPEMEKVDPT